jgi:hypothetical protein
MRLGIMQPYFFPNLGHFALIAATDEWVVFDVTQYTKKSWINRNRILHPVEGWQYFSVPLAQSTTRMKIHDAEVADINALRLALRGKLSHYRKRAPHYDAVLAMVDRTFDAATDVTSLVALNVSGLSVVCKYLGIPFRPRICSELGLAFPDRMGPGDWAPQIARDLGASCYVNPIGGKDLFDPLQFLRHRIDLRFARFGDFTYATPGYEFVPGLSILDVLMWNSPERVHAAARDLMVLVAPDQ